MSEQRDPASHEPGDPWAPPPAPPAEPADATGPVDLNHTQEIDYPLDPAAQAEPPPPAAQAEPPPPAAQAEPPPPPAATPSPVWAGQPDRPEPAPADPATSAAPEPSPTAEASQTGWPGGQPTAPPAPDPVQAAAVSDPTAPQTGWPGQGAAQPASAQVPAPSTQQPEPGAGWDPFSTPQADAGYAGQPPAWTGSQPPAASAPQLKGPGWGALVAVAAAMSLIAATLGGLFGGWLGATDRVDFERLDRTPSSIPRAGPGATARPEGSIAAIAAKALPSVVTIKVDGADGAGTGSGFVLDRDGHILTNNHVIASASQTGTIKVELSDGSEIEATIQGRDSSYDLAVLKTGRTDLEPLTMGVSKDVVVGDQVIAVGAPLGLEATVTSGIVSALNRPVSPGGNGDTQSFINAIQTDAAINPGNSGGPLLNMQGEVIGVNSAIARVPGSAESQSGNIGVGFSIPSDQVVKTAEQLIKTGKAQHPIIGVVLDRQYDGDGVRILGEKTSDSGEPVDPTGPAGKAGVKPGDVIVEFDGKAVNDPDDLVVAIRSRSVGDEVSMKLRRGSETISVTVTLSGTSGS